MSLALTLTILSQRLVLPARLLRQCRAQRVHVRRAAVLAAVRAQRDRQLTGLAMVHLRTGQSKHELTKDLQTVLFVEDLAENGWQYFSRCWSWFSLAYSDTYSGAVVPMCMGLPCRPPSRIHGASVSGPVGVTEVKLKSGEIDISI